MREPMPTSQAEPDGGWPLLPMEELMRQLARHRSAYRGTCPAPRRGGRICGKPVIGYETKRYCSDSCSFSAHRARKLAEQAENPEP